MIAGSLFSGVGGLDHGLARAGFRHGFFCESDPWRRTVLAARWPGVPVYDDVRTIGAADVRLADEQHEGHQLGGEVAFVDRGQAGPSSGVVGVQDARGVAPAVDLLCGGFPCQDLSVAGKRAGLDAGARSGLFFEFARIIDALRPRWILVENVPGLLSSQGGRDFGTVIGTLADLGYGVAWRIVDSRYFGVPQRRRRVFIVGTLAVGDPRAAAERAGEILAVGTSCVRHPPTGREAGPDTAEPFEGGAISTLQKQSGGWRIDAEAAAGGHLIAETLRSHPRPGSNSNGNLITAFAAKGGGGGSFHEDDISPTLSAHGDEEGGQPPAIAFHPTGGGAKGLSPLDDLAPGTGTGTGTAGTVAIAQAAQVRRLTPTECERLQALPDGWTNPTGDAPDSRRYAALGDAVTSSVGEWIGRRIIAADQETAA